MSFAFNPHQGLVIVHAEVLRLALDTGATTTLINAAPLVALGYDPALAPTRIQLTTGSGIEFVPRIQLLKVTALGVDQLGFAVLCHTLPPTTGVDGLLGLDFIRGRTLTLDFKAAQLSLA